MVFKGKGRTISLFLHQKCLNVNSSARASKLLVDANCDDSVIMSKVPKPGCGLESECGTEKLFACLRAHFVHPPISNPGSTPASCPLATANWKSLDMIVPPHNFLIGSSISLFADGKVSKTFGGTPYPVV